MGTPEEKKAEERRASESTSQKETTLNSLAAYNKKARDAAATERKATAGTKAAKPAGGPKGPRAPMTPATRESRALKALLRAMDTRGWKLEKTGSPVYVLKGHKVDSTIVKGSITVDGKYSLQLGQGAIRELDAFMESA